MTEDGKMIAVEFYDLGEVRMGSPYNVGKIRLAGVWVPDLPKTDWQDCLAYHKDGMRVALVRWDTPGNQPGFRLYVLDPVNRSVEISERMPGCCQRLWWAGPDTVAWTAFPDLRGQYEFKRTTS